MTATLGDTTALRHLGLVHDGVDDLVSSVLPIVERALAAGEPVSTLFDRRTSRTLRDALGARGDDLTYASPHAGAPRAQEFLGRLRRTAADAGGARVTILAQYSAFTTPDDELLTGESGINLVLGDLPVTMVCACPRDAAPALLDTVRRSHPAWVGDAGAVDNPAFRPPEDRTPTPGTVWGGVHALRLPFGRTADLARVRTHVAALAAEAGMRGELAQAAVLAVHEASVLACDDAHDAGSVEDACVLDVWTAAGCLVAEVHGPRPAGPGAASGATAGATPDAPAGTAQEAEPRVPRDRLRMAGPLAVVRLFCPDVTARDTATGRATRIVVGT